VDVKIVGIVDQAVRVVLRDDLEIIFRRDVDRIDHRAVDHLADFLAEAFRFALHQ
jgi:hypothetical protein